MAENKTQATTASPAAYLAAIADPARRQDCEALVQLLARATGQAPAMWGTAIVGFGVHRYPLAGGKTGTICAVGFSSRKTEIVLYGLLDGDAADLPPGLGQVKTGKGCVYVKRLADIDQAVLAKRVAQVFAAKHG
jgi:hypothetical protein